MSKHRIIIAGPRDFADYEKVKSTLRLFIRDMDSTEIEIVSGGCSIGTTTYTRNDGTKVFGADGLGERFAFENKLPVKIFEADWRKHGKSAGPIRNSEMAEYSTHCLVFGGGYSRGSQDMAKKAYAKGLIGGVVN